MEDQFLMRELDRVANVQKKAQSLRLGELVLIAIHIDRQAVDIADVDIVSNPTLDDGALTDRFDRPDQPLEGAGSPCGEPRPCETAP